MAKQLIPCLMILCLAAVGPASAGRDETAVRGIADILEPIRRAHDLPAMAGAVVTGKGLEAVGAAGVRKRGTEIAATEDDLWHIGSDTKAMTAVLIGRLVEQGRLKWETTVEQSFPDLAGDWPPEFKAITLRQLLSHLAGLPANFPWGLIPRSEPIREQRLKALKAASSAKLLSTPGAQFLYSNLGYVIAGAIAERTGDGPWEELMNTLVFEPLGMRSAGYGGVGTSGQIDQPWGHLADGQPATGNGPEVDNPPVVGPAGRVHCTLADWARFIADQLRGGRGDHALLKPETYAALHTPPPGGQYALGWMVVEKDWGGGPVLTHAGSNSMNMAVAWLAPRRDLAVLVVANQGGEAAARACDDAASALIRWHLSRRPASSTTFEISDTQLNTLICQRGLNR